MADTAQSQQGGASQGQLIVPPEVEQKFSDLVGLIRKSESMNAEERQYWVNILPIMTPEQIQNLRDILENERKQLAAIDAKYGKELDKAAQEEIVKRTDLERRSRRQQRSSSEASHRQQEEKAAESLLGEIEGSTPAA